MSSRSDVQMIKACYLTNIGKVRTNNEDSLFIHDVILSEWSMVSPECKDFVDSRLIFMVADGMGGHEKGEVASKAVLHLFKDNYQDLHTLDDIKNLVHKAKDTLNKMAATEKSSLGMGTTLSGILIADNKIMVISCGDSRVYRVNGRYLEKITRDHSIVQNLVDIGEITEEEMRTHPQKNVLTSVIMADMKDEIPTVFLKELPLVPGQRFFLCTDGVWESMTIDEMEACFAHEGLDAAARALYEKIMAGQARDNFSMIILEAN